MKWGTPVMTRSRFFCNSSVIRQDLRQHGWIGIIYTLGLLFSFPLQLFMNSYPDAEPMKVTNLFEVGGNIQVLFLISVPVAAGLFLFRYLQSKAPSDLWHSLPLRREHLLAAHTVSGLILLLTPVWLTAAVTALVRTLQGNMYIYQASDVWGWGLAVSILTLFLFVFSIFIGICTGQTVLQGIVIYILLILPAALLQFISIHLSMYLYGYSEQFSLRSSVDRWSPVLQSMDLAVRPFTSLELWIYAALSVVFMGLSFVLYRKRQGEKAGQAIAFTYFNPLFKAGVMLCSMLLSGTYFTSVKSHEPGWIIGSHIAGALLGYVAAEMVIRKTWAILNRRLPGEFALYTVILGLLIYIPVSGLTGYENRVPAEDQISAVYTGSQYHMFRGTRIGTAMISDPSLSDEDPFTSDREYISAVRHLHSALVNMRPEMDSLPVYARVGSRQYTIVYKLNNGREVIRNYYIPGAGFEPEMKAVMESEGFKRKEYTLFKLDKDFQSVTLSHRDKSVSILDPKEIAEFKDILKREIINMSYEDQIGDQMARGYISMAGKPDKTGYGRFYDSNWLPSYYELESWLVEHGYADKILTKPEEVKSAEIFKDEDISRASVVNAGYVPENLLELARSEKRSVVASEAAFIAEILQHQRSLTGRNGEYVVKLEYKNENTEYVKINEKDMSPAFQALLP